MLLHGEYDIFSVVFTIGNAHFEKNVEPFTN